MDVSSSTAGAVGNVQIDTMKKAMDVQERQVLKILESSQEDIKVMSAQKTGMGNGINITA